jgi:hypothetical protein
MRLSLFVVLLLSIVVVGYGQNHGFPFGKPGALDLGLEVYKADTSAQAVVLDEFGEAYIDLESLNKLIFQYHVKIKILKPGGLKQADYSILLYDNNNGKVESLRSVQASAFNRTATGFSETKIDPRKVFTDKYNKHYTAKKFAVPDVRVGTVIEIAYELESPFLFNFRTWQFQDDIPKMHSEYWVSYPANYEYNISLKGFQKLSKQESELVKSCVGSSGGLTQTAGADCLQFKYGMNDIPAFKDEDFMAARSNFLSAINFELATVRHFDGRINRITQEWKDAEQELRQESRFGTQLKRGRDIASELNLDRDKAANLIQAKKIYGAVKGWYQWNETYGIFSESIRKALEDRKGSVADINLSLVAALRYAGFDADPVLLSTRENGFPTELHPVLSDFNYVISRLRIGESFYLLDATDDYLTFGMIPLRCINGKGRVMAEKESFWIDLKPTDRSRQVTLINLTLGADGDLSGTVQNNYTGYAAMLQRKRIRSYSTEQEYVDEVDKVIKTADIKGHRLTDVDSLDKPLFETFDVKVDGFASVQDRHFVLSPFIADRWESNPFKSAERLYPVDFGIPIDETVIISLTLPPDIVVTDLPQKVALALPNTGGRFLFEARRMDNKLSIQSNLIINRTLYTSTEYHYLKELFNQVVSTQNVNIVLER